MSDNWIQTRDVGQGLELAQGTMLDICESDKIENWTSVEENHQYMLDCIHGWSFGKKWSC